MAKFSSKSRKRKLQGTWGRGGVKRVRTNGPKSTWSQWGKQAVGYAAKAASYASGASPYINTAYTVAKGLRSIYKNRTKGNGLRASGLEIETSKCVVKYKTQKPAKFEKAVGQPSIFKQLDAWGVTALSSVQARYNSPAMFAQTGTTGISIQTIFDNAATWWNTITPAAVDEDPTTAKFKSLKFFLQGVTQKHRIVNQMPTVVELDIYDLISKVTQSTLATVKPTDVWDNGLADLRGNGAAVDSTALGITPTTSKIFNQTWKIVKRTRISLMGGKQHNHTFCFSPNRIVDTDYWSTYGMVRGITAISLFVARGGFGDNSETLTTGTIASAPIKLLGEIETTYITRLITTFPRNLSYVNNLPAAPTHLYVQDEESGLVDDLISGLGIAATVAAIA